MVYVLDGAVTLEIVENDGGWRGVMGAFACRLGIAFLQVHAARVTGRMMDMLRSELSANSCKVAPCARRWITSSCCA